MFFSLIYLDLLIICMLIKVIVLFCFGEKQITEMINVHLFTDSI